MDTNEREFQKGGGAMMPSPFACLRVRSRLKREGAQAMPTLHFKGKPLMQNHHRVVPFSELEAVKSRGLSKSPSLHDNLIIGGDNLKAFKALLPAFHGKVNCIYIDPPYNTGER